MHEFNIPLRISREIDVVGDVSATVDNPSELLAGATVLTDPTVAAWGGHEAGHRYCQVTAPHTGPPVHDRVTAVLHCDQHRYYWHALDLEELGPGQTRNLNVGRLSAAWSLMPTTPPGGSASTSPLS